MLLFSTELELRTVRSLTGDDPVLFRRVHPRTSETLFHTRAARRCYGMVQDLVRAGRQPPLWDNLLLDPRVPSDLRREMAAFRGKPLAPVEVDEVLASLKTYSDMRLLAQSAKDILDAAGTDDMDVTALVNSLDARVRTVREGAAGDDRVASGDDAALMAAIMDRTDHGLVPTGFGTWDRVNVGFRRDSLAVMAALPGHGKTQLLLSMALGHAGRGMRVSFVSFEMSLEEMYVRMMANISGVPSKRIQCGGSAPHGLRPGERETITRTVSGFHAAAGAGGVTFRCQPATSDLLELLEAGRRRDGADIIYVDHVGFLNSSDRKVEEWRQIETHMKDAVFFCKSEGVPVVMAAQLADEGQLAYSRRIRNHANYLWEWEADMEAGILDVRQGKCRDGGAFRFRLAIDPATSRVRDAEEGEEPLRTASATERRRGRDAAIVDLVRSGLSYREVSDRLRNVSRTTVARVMKREGERGDG